MTQNEKRFEIFQEVLNQFGDPDQGCELPESADDPHFAFGDIPRFVMVERDQYRDSWYDFGTTAEQLCEGAASDDSDYDPFLIVDLDSGEARFVHVSYRVGDELYATFAATVEA